MRQACPELSPLHMPYDARFQRRGSWNSRCIIKPGGNAPPDSASVPGIEDHANTGSSFAHAHPGMYRKLCNIFCKYLPVGRNSLLANGYVAFLTFGGGKGSS
jgi:hypothetical protein